MKIPNLKQLARERLSPTAFYLLLVCFFEALSLIIAFAMPERGLADLLFANRENSFMDYFHSIMAFKRHSLKNIYYSEQLFYPPLATLFYLLMFRLIPSDAMPSTDFIARERQAAVVPFLIFTVLLSLGVVYVLHALRKGTDLEKKLFAVSMMLSAPMLYQYDRGNIIFLALFFSLLFFYWKDSESRLKRELALVCLAISAGLKIYPAIFGLILLFEKRWKDAAKCCLYGSLSFVLPSLVFGGISPFDMIENLSRMSNNTQGEGFGYKVNYSNTFAMLCSAFRIPYIQAPLTVLSYLLSALVLAAAFVHRKGWKLVCALSLLIVAMPGFSYTYTLIFMIVPTLFFLNECRGTPPCAQNYVYSFLFVCCFAPLPFTGIIYSHYYHGYPLTVSSFAESMAVLILSLMLVVDAFLTVYRKRKHHRTSAAETISA